MRSLRHLSGLLLVVISVVAHPAWADGELLPAVYDALLDDRVQQVRPVELMERLPDDPTALPLPAESLAAEDLPETIGFESRPGACASDFTHCCQNECGRVEWDVLARGYYIYDHRLEFTGQEATFGAEGQVRGAYTSWWGDVEQTVVGEFFLNQPFDRNMLVDTPERRSYRGNFEMEPFEIKQLQLRARYNDWLLALGKMPTPFGRTYFPLVTNDFHDAPFIRTEGILWRETGVLLQFDPSIFVFTAAITNGGPERDANSSKALVARAGIEGDNFAFGASVKEHDGIGSENQKTYKSHVGVDAMVRRGNWILSGECIYDQYGLRRPFNPDNITWGRSIYYRDLNVVNGEPLTGVGYYVDLTYCGPVWSWMFDYGEFYPGEIGMPQHDAVNRRGIVKGIYQFSEHVSTYGMFLKENNLANAQDGRERRAWDVLFGFEFTL